MIEENRPTTRSRPSRRPSAMQMPIQAQPIDRSQARTAGTAGDSGVEADGFWDTFKDIASVAGPILGAIASDRRIKRDIMPVAWSR